MTGTAAMSGSAPEPAQEPGHRGVAVEHRLVHVHVEHHGAVGDLVAGDRDRLVLARRGRRPGRVAISRANWREPGDVGPLADVDEERRRAAGSRAARARTGGSRRRAPGSRAGRGPRRPPRSRPCGRAWSRSSEPATLSRPARAHSPSAVGHLVGRLVVPAQLVGQAGVGVARRPARSAIRPSSSTCSRSCFGPSEQLSPTSIGSAWRTLVQKAARVWPLSVRPDASTIVPLTISGSRVAPSSHSAGQREDRGLRVEGVEDRLEQQDVGAAGDQALAPTRGTPRRAAARSRCAPPGR